MTRHPPPPGSAPCEHCVKTPSRAVATAVSRPQREPKHRQRQRLVDAMIELTAHGGFQSVTVAQVAAHAHVSTATFYELFEDKEDCLLAAYRAAVARMLGPVRPVTGEGNWSQAARAMLAPLLSTLLANPDAAQVLFVEGLSGGRRIRAERKRVLARFERLVQEFLDSPPRAGRRLDIPAIAVMGALRSTVAAHLRVHAEDRLATALTDGLAWLGSYAIPAEEERWSTGPRALANPRAHARSARTRSPARLPRGRHHLPAGAVVRSQRERILYATAEVMMAKGYGAATVADIVARARVSRDVFYTHFSSKQHVFLEAQQHPTQYVLDTCAAAYYSASEWPERFWWCMDALIGLIVANPAISHLRLVECYAAGPVAIRRAEEITRSFTFFLEEGYSYGQPAKAPPRLYSDAIAGAIFEILQHAVAHGEAGQLPRRLPQIVYVAITPFTGHKRAVRLLERLRTA